jgi:hypothetical protein
MLDSAGQVRMDLMATLRAWKEGDLAKADPLHPFLCGLRALHNYKALLAWTKDKQPQRLVTVSHTHATQYYPGNTLPGDFPPGLRMRTNDLCLAAALGTLGVPVLAVEGSAPRCLFVLPGHGYELTQPGTELTGRYDAAHLARRVEQGSPTFSLERENLNHPFTFAVLALRSYKELLTILQSKPTQLLIQSRTHFQRIGIIEAEPSDKLMDKTLKALGMPTRHV